MKKSLAIYREAGDQIGIVSQLVQVANKYIQF
jgi:hypothetical protein